MKSLTLLVLAGFVFTCLGAQALYAGEVDILLNKLVEKGVLTSAEARQISIETKEDVKKQLAKGESESVPKWVQNIKMKGDLRTRYQYEKRKGSNLNLGKTAARHRGRMRLRLGTEAKVNDQVKVNLGLATGGTDPRSTNQTFENSFELKDIRLDYAFAEIMPLSWATLYVGRMKNPIWEPGDMMWDTDINPEGVAAKFFTKWNPSLEPYLTTAYFLIDENANGSDPYLFAVQPGLKWQANDNVSLNISVPYYGFSNMKGAILDHRQTGNTLQNNSLVYGFSCVSPYAELGIKDPLKPLGIGFVPYASLFGEFVHNNAAGYSANGTLGGIKFGHEKVSDWGQWQAKYMYVTLGTNSWPDILPDSDRYSGRTGINSHEAILSYGLGKNWSIDLDYYCSDLSTSSLSDDLTQKTEHLFQVDLNFKF